MNKLYTILVASLFACCIMTTVNADEFIESKQAVSLEKYTNTANGYSLEYPSDWKKNDVPQLDLVLFAPYKEKDDKPLASMNVISEKVGNGINLEQFYSQSATNLSTALKEVNVEKTGTTMLNGTPSKWMQYTHVMQGVKFTVIQYFIVSNETIYLITFSASKDEFEQYRPDFERIANSFKLQVQAPQPIPAPGINPEIAPPAEAYPVQAPSTRPAFTPIR